MSNNQINLGGEWLDPKETKSFNEAFEIRTRRFLMSHIKGENRVDGNLAFVVEDYEELLIGLLEFIENEKNLSNKR